VSQATVGDRVTAGPRPDKKKGWERRDCTHDLLEGGHSECVSTSSRRELWKGRRGNQRLLRKKLSCQLGRPVKLVFVGGWVGLGQHTHAFVSDSGCRSQGENWESTTTNFSPSRLGAVRGCHWPEPTELLSQGHRARAGATHVIRGGKERQGATGSDIGKPAFYDVYGCGCTMRHACPYHPPRLRRRSVAILSVFLWWNGRFNCRLITLNTRPLL
jgi:hypothetical protein